MQGGILTMPTRLRDVFLVAGLVIAFGFGYLVARTAHSTAGQIEEAKVRGAEIDYLTSELSATRQSMAIDSSGHAYQEPNAEQVKILMDRYHASIGLSAKQYEQDTKNTITGQQAAVLVWLVKRTEHPCMMPLRFLRAHTDQIVNLSLSMDLELPDTTR